jgi:hypothetical protein
MHELPLWYVPLGQLSDAWQEEPVQEVPGGQLVMLVMHFDPSKKVPAGQFTLVEVEQMVPFQKVPGGHWMGVHLKPSQVYPEGQVGCLVHTPFSW